MAQPFPATATQIEIAVQEVEDFLAPPPVLGTPVLMAAVSSRSPPVPDPRPGPSSSARSSSPAAPRLVVKFAQALRPGTERAAPVVRADFDLEGGRP